jgi:tetratricopeptide (TPR) repeat protein
VNLGVARFRQGDYGEAVEYLKKAIKIVQDTEDREIEAACYMVLGRVLHSLSNYREAIRWSEKSLEIYLNIQDRVGEARCYGNLGAAYSRLGNHRKAIDYYKKSLKIFEETGDKDLLRIINTNLGRAYYNQDPNLAYRYLRRAIELSEVMGRELVEEEHKIGFYGLTTDAYQFMIPLCLDLNKKKKAFEYTERGKSKAFLDMLAATDIRPSESLAAKKSLLEEPPALLDFGKFRCNIWERLKYRLK